MIIFVISVNDIFFGYLIVNFVLGVNGDVYIGFICWFMVVGVVLIVR